MANIQHRDIPEAQLHEPKGASTSTSGHVMTSTGGASSWAAPVTQVDATGKVYGSIPLADGTNTTYGNLVWKDLVAYPIARIGGGGGLATAAFRGGNYQAIHMGAGDSTDFVFHLPHDYAMGTDIYLHVHWAHNGTAISGNMDWVFSATQAKGHAQAIFPAEITGTISIDTVGIGTTPRYSHRIDEIQFSTSGGSASMLNTDDLEVDGLILVHVEADVIPTITGGSPNEPFIFSVDIHYQADKEGTLNKAPNFFA